MRLLPELFTEMELVGEAETPREAAAKAVSLKPDVILLDVDMSDMQGLKTVGLVKERGFKGKVVIVSADTARLQEAVEAGVAGYVLKSAPLDELLSVLRSAHREGFVFGASVMDTPEGLEIALLQIAWKESQRREESSETKDSASPGPPKVERSSAYASPKDVGRPQVVPIELTISGPVELPVALKLHDWLKAEADIELTEVAGSWSGSVTLKVTMSRPVPLMRMLTALPYVESVKEEPAPTAHSESPEVPASLEYLPGLSTPDATPKRYRLVLKSE